MDRCVIRECPHLYSSSLISVDELSSLDLQNLKCQKCFNAGPNIWICLYANCLQTGCSEQANDHSTDHFRLHKDHCVHMNLSSQRTWCYLCENEVMFSNQRKLLGVDTSFLQRVYGHGFDLRPAYQTFKDNLFPKNLFYDSQCGLLGLQNIANTCYMNSALQALCHIPELTNYFLDYGHVYLDDSLNNKKLALSRSYCSFVKEAWRTDKKPKDYIVPIKILTHIRSVYPMFRGFQQHDTQEFLRCFMDQLHEELKETFPSMSINRREYVFDDLNEEHYCSSQSSQSQSEAEYETCDSGVSEPSSLIDESLMSKNMNKLRAGEFLPKISNVHKVKTNAKESSYQNVPLIEQHQKSIVSEIFDGKLLSSVQCLTCDLVSIKEETFQDLSLPIPNKDHLAVLHNTQGMITSNINQLNLGSSYSDTLQKLNSDSWLWWMWTWFKSWVYGPSVTLHDCLASFFSADELKGDNMYSCDKCSKLRNGMKYSRVLDLPEILCVHLKRFRHDLSYSSKISSYIHFPLDGLDMQQFMHKDCKSTIYMYNLVSLICHHGTVGGGHYTSFAKHCFTGKWYEFDDQHVREVSPEVVQSCQAYVLFYRKHNPEMSTIQEEAYAVANSYSINSDIRFYISRQWLNRFQTFAEPGPIDNRVLLCPHAACPPGKLPFVNKIAVPISQLMWDYFYKRYGGGPVCNRIFECDICKRAEEVLSSRQRCELEQFSKYNDEFQSEDDDNDAIYAISMVWLREWQSFARGLTLKEPGPIHNSSISEIHEGSHIITIKPGSDYAQLNSNLWHFFYSIYGGGPEIILRNPINIERHEASKIHDISDKKRYQKHSKIKQPEIRNPKTSSEHLESSIDECHVKDIWQDELVLEHHASNKKKSDNKNTKQSNTRKSKKNSKLQPKAITKKSYSEQSKSGLFGMEGTYIPNKFEDNYSESKIRVQFKNPNIRNQDESCTPHKEISADYQNHRKKIRVKVSNMKTELV